MLRPTFMGFETAKRAINVNQKAVDIVANNLSNVDTNGYTRQRLDVTSIAPNAYATKIASSRVGLLGQGVDALGVGQLRDSFLDKRFREEYGKASYHGHAKEILDDIQSALGDGQNLTNESVLFGAMKQIFESLNDYVSEPTLDAQANLVMTAFKNITQVLQQLDAKLTNAAAQHIYDTGVTVNRVNDILDEITYYNKMISEDATVMSDPNNEYFRPTELLDKRNLLLDELASYGDINVVQLSNGMVNVDFAGQRAVTGTEHETARMYENDDQTITLRWVSSGKDLQLSSGTLLASRDFINGRGKNIRDSHETIREGIPYYRDRLNTFATALVNVVNQSIPERAYPDDAGNNELKVDSNGDTIFKTLLGARQADGSVSANGPVTAANISISDEWN
ncbi:MAG: flagellar basal body protein, partial [Peptococcaceae bacterium]|nr:flagellar basal body protein [Peptococcaceae bacterium]